MPRATPIPASKGEEGWWSAQTAVASEELFAGDAKDPRREHLGCRRGIRPAPTHLMESAKKRWRQASHRWGTRSDMAFGCDLSATG